MSASDLWLRSDLADDAEAWLTAVFSSVDIGIFLTGLDHLALAANRAFAEIWGVDPARVVSEGVEEVREMVEYRVPDPESWRKNLDMLYDDPTRTQTDRFILLYPFKSVLRKTSPVYKPDGSLVGRIWTFEDVTEEDHGRRMREALYQMSLIFDPDPSVVYEKLVDQVAGFYGSLSFLSIRVDDFMEFWAVGGPAGHPAKEMAGNQLAESYCQFCLREAKPTIIQNALDDPEAKETLPAKFGITRYAGVPIMAPDGEILGTFCIMDDRSETPLGQEDLGFLSVVAVRLGSEVARMRRLRRLESELTSTSAELSQLQATAIEREKLAIVGAISAGVAHDIRNIVSALSLEIDMGSDRPDETLTAIRPHLDRFRVLSHRLLSYAKPSRNAEDTIDLAETIERVVSLLRGQMSLSAIETQVALPLFPKVRGDSVRMEHLFVNLVVNAIQAMPKGGILRFEGSKGDGWLEIAVSDTGKGISTESARELFLPFGSSGKREGFGLGLYSCRRIAEDAGGSIRCVTDVPVGARFVVRLPLP